LDPVGVADRRPPLPGCAVDKDVHVLADAALLVEHPAGDRRVRLLERPEHLTDGGARDRVAAAAAEL
jgi:hypothetical protein